MAGSPGRLVYSTAGRVCADCQRMASHCVCGKAPPPVPSKITAKLRLETRRGKSVTVVANLPANDAFLAELAHDLKKAMGAGGTVRDGNVELQGDCRERLRPVLGQRGFTVKG